MTRDIVHSHCPKSARQRPPLRRRLPMPAYEPPARYSEFLQRMLARAKESLGGEFRGITTDGIVRPGLFPVRKTGVSLAPILRAAGKPAVAEEIEFVSLDRQSLKHSFHFKVFGRCLALV